MNVRDPIFVSIKRQDPSGRFGSIGASDVVRESCLDLDIVLSLFILRATAEINPQENAILLCVF